jgi:hypothetical protein
MMKMFENSPRLLKAAQVAMTSAKAGVVMGGQEAAHGGTVGESAKQAAVGVGLGIAGSAVWGAGKMGFNALKSAGWSGAALDAVTKVASENVKPAEEIGDILSHKINNAQAVMHTTFDNAMEEIRGKIGTTPIPVSGSPLHEAAVTLSQEAEHLPEGIKAGLKGLVPSEGTLTPILEGITDGSTKELTGSQLIDLRQQLSKQLPRIAPVLKEGVGKLLDGIDDTLDKMAGEAGNVEGVSDTYTAARSAYKQTLSDLKEGFVQRIQNGKISDALDMLGKGQEAPHRLDVLKRLIGEDTVAGLGLNKFADVIKGATDEDGNLLIKKAIASWDKLADETKKSMFSATPEVGQRLEGLMDGLRTMQKVRTAVKMGVGLSSLGLGAAAASAGFKGTLSAVETVAAVAGLIGIGSHGGQEFVEKVLTSRPLLEGLGKLYGYTGENVVQRLGQAGTETAEQLAKRGAEGPALATGWQKVVGAAQNLGGEEGAAGRVTKRKAGEPGTSSLIGKRGVKAPAPEAPVASGTNRMGEGMFYEHNPAGLDDTNMHHSVTTQDFGGNKLGELAAQDTKPGEITVRSNQIYDESLRSKGRGSDQLNHLLGNVSDDTHTVKSDISTTDAARGAWEKLAKDEPDAVTKKVYPDGQVQYSVDMDKYRAEGVKGMAKKEVPSSIRTREGAQRLLDTLNVDGLKNVGSVAIKGKSSHDLDMLASSKETAAEAREKLEANGFEWMGSGGVSPKEAARYGGGKTYGDPRLWSVNDKYVHRGTGEKLDVWHKEKGE